MSIQFGKINSEWEVRNMSILKGEKKNIFIIRNEEEKEKELTHELILMLSCKQRLLRPNLPGDF